MTATIATPKNIDSLRAAYDLTFANFATDNAEIAKALNVTPTTANRLLLKLEQAGLVCSTDVNSEAQGSGRRGQFKPLTWQCNETYDSIDERQAAYLFDVAFGLITEPPADIPDAPAPAPTPEQVDHLKTWLAENPVQPEQKMLNPAPATEETSDMADETKAAAPAKVKNPKTAQLRAEREARAAAKAEPTTEPAASAAKTDAAAVTGAQLMKDLNAQIKRAVRGAQVKTSPKGAYTTVRVAKTPVAYIDVRKASIDIAVALPEAPKDIDLTFKPNTRHNDRFAVETKVSSAEQFDAALVAIELAAAKVAA